MPASFIYLKNGQYFQVTERTAQSPLQHRLLGAITLSTEQQALLDQTQGNAFEARLQTFRDTLVQAFGIDPQVLQQYEPRNAVTAGSQTPSTSTTIPAPAATGTPTTTTGTTTPGTTTPTTGGGTTPTSGGGGSTAVTDEGKNFRVRLSHLDGAPNKYPGILAPLEKTRGLLFPYTPTIAVTQDVDYDQMAMVHSNTNYHTYARTPNVNVSITGKFTVQNHQEGLYALAAIHFMRSVSKMYFGERDAADGLAGIPPPILHLNGYGPYMFNNLRCVVKSHNWTFDENMNTVAIKAGAHTVRLPALFTISMTLTVQQTSRAMRKDFKLDEFKSGALMLAAKNNTGWI